MKVGFIGGKFMPLHVGHLDAIMQAKTYVDKLYVFVCHNDKQPYSGKQRASWLGQELYDMEGIEIKLLEDTFDENGVYSWEAGAKDIKLTIQHPIDYIFSSEATYDNIFKLLYPTSEHIIFDRKVIPISATMIRENPYKYWEYLPKSVRSFFTKKVCVVGVESCGKSTLVKSLAKIYNTNFQPEVGRKACEEYMNEIPWKQFDYIAMEHSLGWKDKARYSNKVLFIDSDAVITEYYLEAYYNSVSPFLEDMAYLQDFDLYLFLEPDVEWVGDGFRFLHRDRDGESWKLQQMYKDLGVEVVVISGSYTERLEKARLEVEKLFKG